MQVWPVVFCAAFFVCCAGWFFLRDTAHGLRDALLKAGVLFLALVAVTTEIASLANAVTFHFLAAIWVVLVLGAGLGCYFAIRRHGSPLRFLRERLATAYSAGRIEVAVIAVVLAVTLLTAILAAPTNYDSLTYHLARVAHWIQNGNVSFYATNIDRQNWEPPLAEFALLHLQILSGSDTCANWVQWVSFGLTITAASLLAREFGQSLRVQLLASVLAATVPMSIVQSSGTQNDLVAAFLCATFVYFLMRFLRNLAAEDIFFGSLAAGLALLTKGTAYFICPVFGLVLGAAALIRAKRPLPLPSLQNGEGKQQRSRMAVGGVLAVLVALLLNAGHYSRNLKLYGNPLSTTGQQTLNAEVTLAGTFANCVRNAALHAVTRSEQLRLFLERHIAGMLGSELNNSATTYRDDFSVPRFSTHDAFTGNPLHLALGCLAFLLLPVLPRATRKNFAVYALALLLATLQFCALVRWQPWGSRLHTPLFVLLAPLVASVFAECWKALPKILVAVPLACFYFCLPFLFTNETRPLWPSESGFSILSADRDKQYRVVCGERLWRDYKAAVDFVRAKEPGEIGLYAGPNDPEYLLWLQLGSCKLRHVSGQDISSVLAEPQTPPEWVLATQMPPGNRIDGAQFETFSATPRIIVLRRQDKR